MEQIKTIIEKKKKRLIAGRELKCRRCSGFARIVLEDKCSYFVNCYTCQDHTLLREYNLTKE